MDVIIPRAEAQWSSLLVGQGMKAWLAHLLRVSGRGEPFAELVDSVTICTGPSEDAGRSTRCLHDVQAVIQCVDTDTCVMLEAEMIRFGIMWGNEALVRPRLTYEGVRERQGGAASGGGGNTWGGARHDVQHRGYEGAFRRSFPRVGGGGGMGIDGPMCERGSTLPCRGSVDLHTGIWR